MTCTNAFKANILPQFAVMSQSDWPIYRCRQRCLRQGVTSWTHTERIVLSDIDIGVKKQMDSGLAWYGALMDNNINQHNGQNLLRTQGLHPLCPQHFDHCDDEYCCRREYRPR